MHHVERSVWKLQRVHVADTQLDRNALPAGVGARLCEHFGSAIEADDAARRHQPREIHCDRARPTAHVEEVEPRSKGGQEVAGGVLCRAPCVTAQHRFVMSMGIDVVRHRHRDSADSHP